jgi:hypothetical protein
VTEERYGRRDPDTSQVSGKFVAECIGESPAVLSTMDGAPRNGDKSYNLLVFLRWWRSQRFGDREALELDKLRKQTQKLELELEEKRDNYLEKSYVETLMTGRALALKEYLHGVFMKNVHHLAHKPVDGIRSILESLVREAMNAWSRGHS